MKKYCYKPQLSRLVCYITLFIFTISQSYCGTGKDENIENPELTPNDTTELTPEVDVLEKVSAATQVAGKYFFECNSISELEKHLDKIKNTEGVVDVWTDDQTMYVDYEDWGIMPYYYPVIPESEEMGATRVFARISDYINTDIMNNTSTRTEDIFNLDKTHHRLNDLDHHSLVIYNALSADERFSNVQKLEQKYVQLFDSMGYKLDLLNSQESYKSFFHETMYNYDMVLIMTHGGYLERNNIKKHWLMSGLLCKDKRLDNGYWGFTADEIRRAKEEDGGKNAPFSGIATISEKVNGELRESTYWMISEDGLALTSRQFAKESIVFCSACKSLEDTQTIGDIFCNKGAACYLGYDNINSVGNDAAYYFFKGLFNGLSVQSSFNNLDYTYKYEQNARLHIIVKDNDVENKHVCITHPVTESYEENDYSTVLLKGSIKIADPNNNNEYGFALHTPGSNTVSPIKPGLIYSTNKENFVYNTASHILTFSCSVDKKEFNDIDKFCAYLYDGERYCLGNLVDITIEIPTGEEMGYAEYKDNVLTFKFGVKPEGKEIYEIPNDLSQIDIKYGLDNSKNAPGWYKHYVRKVVFDPSFANFRPVCTNRWFCGVSEFVGLEYLNTSQVVDMSHMFYGCEDLEKLDLSHFDTKNVINMEHMFDHCWKLSELNVSSFNTEKVQTMSHMFDHCWSINNLSLSNFDTSNVQDMRGMFSDCEFSLTSLDLSNFNTKNVLSMNGMFKNCDALENLDLSNFDTSNVIEMDSMFFSCNNLASLDISNFNTKKVCTMSYMFSGCKKLEKINVSSFDTRNLKDMRCMFRNCKSLMVLDLSSFNTDNLGKMEGMFNYCSNLKTIYVSKWKAMWEIDKSIFRYVYCFSGCDNLVGGKGSTIAILKSMQEKVHSSVSSGDVFCAKIDEGHKSIFDIGFFTKK